MMNEKLSYMKDEKLYALWKLLNGYRLLGRDLMRFEDVIVPGEHESITAFALCQDLRFRKLELKGWVFHLDLYKKHCPKEYDAVMRFIKEKPAVGFSKSVADIFSGKFKTEDVEIACLLPAFSLVEWFEFDADLPDKTKKVIGSLVDEYIDQFIADELRINDVNFLKFERQKDQILRSLEGFYLGSYGDTFVYKTSEPMSYLGEMTDSERAYLFVHTLIALEKLDYLTIDAMWVFDMDLPPEKQTENYKVKMTVTEKLREEASKTFGLVRKKQSAPKVSSPLVFDAKRSTLSFKGKEIEIAKSKNTNPHYLLETIFKDKKKAWSYDEIAEDWERSYEKEGWRRYYYAAYSVNEKVEKKTGISDFLDITNKSVSIKKEYL